ncbi:hypothetical protein EVAR_45864_1 [Eumeta japonica]|uniref:Uncharacterized protein n=1 Tax=Eumeta variegata TaxID=151549 RepID=A0A4C1WPK8_EUMVA|nr:hypothetical protein EVAR_45864_1 [Eumeta japonica]
MTFFQPSHSTDEKKANGSYYHSYVFNLRLFNAYGSAAGRYADFGSTADAQSPPAGSGEPRQRARAQRARRRLVRTGADASPAVVGRRARSGIRHPFKKKIRTLDYCTPRRSCVLRPVN